METICNYCNKLFTPEKKGQLYCSVKCREDKNRERARENDSKNKALRRKRKKQKPLVDIAVEARKAGMSYGQYVAMKG